MKAKKPGVKMKTAQVNLRVTQEMLDELDELRGRLGMNRNEFLEALIQFAIDDNRWIIKAVSRLLPYSSGAKLKEALECKTA
jgi:metal-responsive CopG/Arc/MetJ family transcriptional regulator